MASTREPREPLVISSEEYLTTAAGGFGMTQYLQSGKHQLRICIELSRNPDLCLASAHLLDSGAPLDDETAGATALAAWAGGIAHAFAPAGHTIPADIGEYLAPARSQLLNQALDQLDRHESGKGDGSA